MSEPDKPIIIERTIDAPADRVWRALTDIKELRQWSPFLPDFKPEAGFVTEFQLGKDPEHQYLHHLEVTEVVDGRKLTYSWRYNGYAGDSYVTFELFAEGSQTKLRLTHKITEPFPAENPDFGHENFQQGWSWTVGALEKFVTST